MLDLLRYHLIYFLSFCESDLYCQNICDVCQDVEKLIRYNLQHPVGTAQTDDEFYVTFLSLLDRVLGEDATGRLPSGTWSKGSAGGWLKTSSKSGFFHSKPRGSTIAVPASNAVALLSLFLPEGSIFKMFGRSKKSYRAYIDLLPAKIQIKMYRYPEYEAIKSSNEFIYSNWISNVSDVKQITYSNNNTSNINNQSNIQVMLDLFTYFLVCFLRYPLQDGVFPTPNVYRPSNNQASTLRSYFGMDIGSNGNDRGGDNSEITLLMLLRCEGAHTGWSMQNPYLVLLIQYLGHFLPPISVSTMPSDISSSLGLSTQGELFLRMTIDYWIDCNYVAKFHLQNIHHFRHQMSQRRSSRNATSSIASNLSSMTNLENKLNPATSSSIHTGKILID